MSTIPAQQRLEGGTHHLSRAANLPVEKPKSGLEVKVGPCGGQRGILRFCDELIARVARAGAGGVKLLRADSGSWSTKLFARLERAGWAYSIGVRMTGPVRELVEQIDDQAPTAIEDSPTRTRRRSPRRSWAPGA